MTPRRAGAGVSTLLALFATGARAEPDEAEPDGEPREEGTPTDDDEPALETVVVARRAREVGAEDLSAEELRSTAASTGSPLRVVESLPGVARGPSLGGQLVIRGSAPEDSLVLLDGFPIPYLYHVGGLTSVPRADVLESMRFVPGNFSVRTGRATGGVVEVATRPPARELHLELEASFLDAGVLLDAPIGSRAGVTVALRRSFLDQILDAVVPTSETPFFAVPAYWDYELHGIARLSRRDSLRAMVLGAGDEVGLVSAPSADPRLRGTYRSDAGFHRAVLQWKHRGDPVDHALGVSIGTTSEVSVQGATYDRRRTVHRLAVRDDVEVPLGPWIGLAAGLDFEADRVEPDLTGLPPALTDEDALPVLGGGTEVTEPRWIARPAAFVETRLRATPALVLTTGVRADHDTDVGRAVLQPRAAARWAIGPGTAVRAGFGVYARAPDLDQTDPALGRPGLGFEKALHLGLGVDRRLPAGLRLEVDGFFKSLWDLVGRRTTDSGAPGALANDGVGRVVGATVLLRRPACAGPDGWVSYTLMRSERRAGPGEPYRPFELDQTHILTAVASWPLGGGLQVGARFRLISGNPETPILGPDRFDSDSALFVPRYGRQSSARLPVFHQLDLRVAYRFRLPGCALSAFVDVQNVYDRRNVEGWEYRYDYRARVRVSALPFLPLLGATGEF